eukprot:1356522-Rhodomonas_salina.2
MACAWLSESLTLISTVCMCVRTGCAAGRRVQDLREVPWHAPRGHVDACCSIDRGGGRSTQKQAFRPVHKRYPHTPSTPVPPFIRVHHS